MNSREFPELYYLDLPLAPIKSAVFNAGIRPSVQRLSEYTLAASASPLAEEKIDGIRAMLADILRREEEDDKLRLSEPAMKKLFYDLESDTDFENKSVEIS